MIKLYQGDCLDILPTLSKINAIITDPPYGLEYRKNTWDKEIPCWLPSAQRICRNIVFTTAPTTIWDYPKPDWMCIWHRRAASSRAAIGGFNHWSPILVYGKARFPIDYFETAFGQTVQENIGIEHPSPKPIKLYKWLIESVTEPLDVVVDPFMGSGTTGVACVQTGRSFIGIEIDPTYYALAEKRIADARLQTSLFDNDSETRYIQEALVEGI